MSKWIIYNTEAEALTKADEEGASRNYCYYRGDPLGSRYHTKPDLTTSNKWALRVDDYGTLTEEEQAKIVTSVTFA